MVQDGVGVRMAEIELTFLGTGTSAGVPMIGCDCAVCTSADPRDKRTRCSIVVRSWLGGGAGGEGGEGGVGGEFAVLVDTTPELRLQAVGNGVKRVDAVVYTHGHADHIMGLDDVRRFNSIKGGALDVWADAKTHKTLTTCFGYAFKEPEADLKLFRPHLEWREIRHDEAFELGGVEWMPIPLTHGGTTVLGFRLRRPGGGGGVAYCTDVNHIPEESFRRLEGVEVLILDALQWKKHATHFTVEEAIEAARRIGAKQTWFTHAAHGVSHAEANRMLPPEMQFAYDGQVVRVGV